MATAVTEDERAALQSALRLPWPSFPCDAQKRPTVRGGFKSARTVDSGLASMWARNPGVLIGVPTGTASGFSVLDVDIAKGGDVWWSANRGKLPWTRMHETRSGGVHVLFRHREGIRNTAGRIAKGIDTRGDGGYVVYWPAEGLGVSDPEDLADWPDWLKPPELPPPPPPFKVKRTTGQVYSENIELKLLGLVKFVERAAEGGRNGGLYWAAMRFAEYVAAGALDRTWGAELLAEAGRRAGLPETEARKTIASAMRRSGV
jgi:hypothetical protein